MKNQWKMAGVFFFEEFSKASHWSRQCCVWIENENEEMEKEDCGRKWSESSSQRMELKNLEELEEIRKVRLLLILSCKTPSLSTKDILL